MGKFVSKNGRYQTGRAAGVKNTGEQKKSKKKLFLIIGIVILLLIIGVILAVVLYMNSLMGLMANNNTSETYPTMSDEEIQALLHPENDTDATDSSETTETTVETSPEDTWPVIESDENLTHIMVVGHSAREGENYKLADSMILCTINRETKTLTMTSFLRDMYVIIPAYWGHTQGGNKMNVVYHLGYHYGGDGMEMLEICMEQNFGIKVDHTVEVDFEIFEKIVDILGGVKIELTEAEADHMTNGVPLDNFGTYEPGMNTLTGFQALQYVRIRKIDSDFKRTERQRKVITSLIDSCRNMGIMDIHELATEILPMIKTNMSTTQMWNYAFEFIPMLKDLKLESITIPEDVNWWSENIGSAEAPNYVLKCNTRDVNALLRERLGIVDEETE